MEIISKNSEISFADFLEVIQEDPALWMCVHVRMSSLNDEILNTEGLTANTLNKIHQISLQLAKKMYEVNLKRADGKLFVFEDGDIVTLFSCKDLPNMQIVDKLRGEFALQGIGSIYSYYTMKDKLAALIKLSKKKIETAKAYQSKKSAINCADSLLKLIEPEMGLQKTIQIKRQQREAIIVLIIEDDLVTRALIAAGLKKDYITIQAKDAKSGIAAYIDHAPNVVLLDIHLPDYSGHEVLSALKRLDPESYIVMLSADSLSSNVISTNAHGSAGFIKKPFSKERIIEYVQKCPLKKISPSINASGLSLEVGL